MNGNEKGFVYPLTVIICFLLGLVIIQQADGYITEKRFIYEQERMLQLESLLKLGKEEFLRMAQREDGVDKYDFSFDVGTVTMSVRSHSNQMSEVTIEAILKTGHRRMAGFNYYWDHATVESYWEVSRNAT